MKIVLVLIALSVAWGKGRTPIAFEPNRGQAPAGVDFIAHGSGYALSLGAGRATWISRGSRIATVFEGARNRAVGEAEMLLPGVVNYLHYHGESPALSGIPTYGRVRYRGVYRGIDVVYYSLAASRPERLEYDFVVAPGADPRQIRLRYEGARSMQIDSEGDLLLETADGTIRQQHPVIYQEANGVRSEVPGRYVLSGKTVRFQVGRYQHSRPLIIDPALSWATYLGFGNGDSGEAVTVDSTGNIYIAGSLISSFGDADVFVAKLSSDGTRAIYTAVFSSQNFPGSDNDYGHAVAVDSAGNLYVAGETASADFLADGTYIASGASAGVPHVFVSKLNANGNSLIYSHYVAGNSSEAAYGIAIDAAGNAFLAGATNSTNFPATTGTAQNTRAGGWDAFVMKFDANGTRVYGTYLGGTGDDFGNAIALDASGDAFIVGSTASTNFKVTSSAYRQQNAGGTDAFVSELSPSGSLVFSTYLGGTGNDTGNGIAVDSSGAVYLTGETASSDFPTLKAYQTPFGGGTGDIFVTKLASDGASLAYSTYLGGTGEDFANAIALDAAGNVYITGSTSSTDFPVSDAFQTTNKGSANAVVAAFDPSGASLLFSSYLGGSGSAGMGGDTGSGIAVSCAAGLVVTGLTTSKDFPTTTGTLAPSFQGGGSNAFLARIAASGVATIASGGVVNSATSTAAPVAPGSLITIYGSAMALGTQAAPSTPLPTSLAGASVTINGTPAPIVFASTSQMNVQLPYETGFGSASATVTVPCGTSAPIVFPVAQVAPYIFQLSGGVAAARNQDNSINGPTNPAKTGSAVTVYLTGIGPLDNPVATGAPAPITSLSRATLKSTATIGGFDTTVQFLGLTPQAVGLGQANLVVPSGLSPGPYPVVIVIGGVPSNAPTLYVQ